jgi:tRNA-modifying protein YgfZ
METLKAAPIERDVVVAHGPDARDYLQTQLTQDVVELDVGEATWSFLLEPKSEIVALLRVTRSAEDTLLLDTEVGWGERIRERIDGFLFRTDVEFTSERWPGVAYRGPGARSVAAHSPIVAPVRWRDIEGLDVVGPGVEPIDGVEVVDEKSYGSLRVWAGWPIMGADIDETTTPAMTGLVDQTVSFTKGCYTGQEFVARVHYRRADPPRRLVQVRFHPCAQVTPGDDIVAGGTVVGTVTSVAQCQPFALGYVKRSVDLPAEVTCGNCPATVVGAVRPSVSDTDPHLVGS